MNFFCLETLIYKGDTLKFLLGFLYLSAMKLNTPLHWTGLQAS